MILVSIQCIINEPNTVTVEIFSSVSLGHSVQWSRDFRTYVVNSWHSLKVIYWDEHKEPYSHSWYKIRTCCSTWWNSITESKAPCPTPTLLQSTPTQTCGKLKTHTQSWKKKIYHYKESHWTLEMFPKICLELGNYKIFFFLKVNAESLPFSTEAEGQL